MSLKRTVCALTLAAIAATAGVSARHLVLTDGANRQAHGGGANRHVAWCTDRFRSYRRWDNSFQPRNGPRPPCLSPYHADRLKLFVRESDTDPGTTGAIPRRPMQDGDPPAGD